MSTIAVLYQLRTTAACLYHNNTATGFTRYYFNVAMGSIIAPPPHPPIPIASSIADAIPTKPPPLSHRLHRRQRYPQKAATTDAIPRIHHRRCYPHKAAIPDAIPKKPPTDAAIPPNPPQPSLSPQSRHLTPLSPESATTDAIRPNTPPTPLSP